MNWRNVAPYVLWYSVFAAGLTMAGLYAVSRLAAVDFGLLALLATGAALLVGPLLVGTTDTGLEAASTGAEAGFGGANPMDLQPDTLPVPGRAALVFYCVGIFVAGVLALVLVV